MDPPSIDAIAKYIFEPARPPPPPPPPKGPIPLEPRTSTSFDQHMKENAKSKEEQPTLSLKSIIDKDKHGGEVYFVPKPRPAESVSKKNDDGTVTTITKIPPHSSVTVEGGKHKILFKNPFPPLPSLTDRQPDGARDDESLRDTNDTPPTPSEIQEPPDPQLDSELTNKIALQSAKIGLVYSNTDWRSKKRPKKDSSRRKTQPKNAATMQPQSTINTVAGPRPSRFVEHMFSVVTRPTATISVFFEPALANDITTRPEYFEVYPEEKKLGWLTCPTSFGDYATIPVPAPQNIFGIPFDHDGPLRDKQHHDTEEPSVCNYHLDNEPDHQSKIGHALPFIRKEMEMHRNQRLVAGLQNCTDLEKPFARAKTTPWPLFKENRTRVAQWQKTLVVNAREIAVLIRQDAMQMFDKDSETCAKAEDEEELRKVMKLKSVAPTNTDGDQTPLAPVNGGVVNGDSNTPTTPAATEHNNGKQPVRTYKPRARKYINAKLPSERSKENQRIFGPVFQTEFAALCHSSPSFQRRLAASLP